MRRLVLTALLMAWPISARAIPCEQFTARFLEGAAYYRAVMMGIGLYAYALDWREAVEMRNELMRAAKASDTHQARAMVEDGEASLIISFAGLPSFQIDRK